MVSGVSNTYNYNGNTYVRRSQAEAELGAWTALAAAAGLKALLPSFSNPFLKQMSKEHANNELYRDTFIKACKNSKLEGLKWVHLALDPSELNLPQQKIANYDVKVGLNAFFSPQTKEIVLNMDRATIAGFHELGHAMNNMSGKFGKLLQKMKMRNPGYWFGIMSTIALFSRPKPKDAPRNVLDWVQDNCHWIAVAGMLPTVAEEALASYKGIKAAKAAGLAENLVKNLRKFYGKALLSYVGHTAVIGLSVYTMSKIMELFTRPKKVN